MDTLKSGEKRVGYSLLEWRCVNSLSRHRTVLNLGLNLDIEESLACGHVACHSGVKWAADAATGSPEDPGCGR